MSTEFEDEKPIRSYQKRGIPFNHNDPRYFKEYYKKVLKPNFSEHWEKVLQNQFEIKKKLQQRNKKHRETIARNQALIKQRLQKIESAREGKTKTLNQRIAWNLKGIKRAELRIVANENKIAELNKKIRNLQRRGFG